MEFFPEPLESGASDELAKRVRSFLAERGWGVWAVEVKGGTPFIGFVGLQVPAAALLFSPCVEIAWRLCASHWGRGYASEAARASLKVAFEQLALPEVIAFTAIGNLRSRRVMECLGMQPARMRLNRALSGEEAKYRLKLRRCEEPSSNSRPPLVIV